jgi:PAS domain S-box-containing protein
VAGPDPEVILHSSFPDDGFLLKLLAKQAPAVLWSTDADLRITSSLGAIIRPMGPRLMGMHIHDYFGTRDRNAPPIAGHLKALAGERASYELEWKNRVYHARVEPLRGPDGAVTGTLGMALDITERKRAEAALQESEERWKAAVSQAPDFFVMLDREGRIFYINRIRGDYGPEEVIGTSTFDFVPPAYHRVMREAYTRAFETGEVVTYEIESYVDSKGSIAWFRNRVGPLYRNGRIANLILISTDITESKRAEAAIKDSFEQMRKLAARLQSAREEERRRIALDIHDRLGQALTGLKLDLSSLAPRLGKDREGRRRARAVFRALDDTIRTVREISTGLRPAVLDGLGLKAAIEWQAREFQSRTGLKGRLVLPARDTPLDPDRSVAVFRIFQEILTNIARHARARRADIRLESAPRSLMLRVTDDGKGISPKALKDPSSLGLLGMRERALAFGGTVDVRGRRGRGTSVTVTVPLPPRRRKP